METEIWKDVAGYEGFYQVSNFGKVKSLKRFAKFINGLRIIPTKIMVQFSVNGYRRVVLHKSRIKTWKLCHRLVALAFIPNPENKPDINHLDSVRHNNFVGNLEWVTKKENTQHAMGKNRILRMKGESHHNSKLKIKEVLEIRNSKEKTGVLSRKYKVTTSAIYNIRTNRRWVGI